ncbi:MAG: LLM class flavin-dependent oxidoreductase [Aquabacterium sp.]|jgi:FMN-dependent oxidoreductase (nitrilotriacetate monooxygenase family)|nr:MAG: LLM class flavin-dependent oxidoreductase [Aquabacterium sp.]
MAHAPRRMSIGMNILGHGGHASAWRYGEVSPTAHLDIGYYLEIARISERGKLDAIFLADGPAVIGDVSRGPTGRLEPTIVLTAIALATERLGVIATASTSYNDPYNLARRIASLDHVSRGRAAWNAVTTAGDAAALNFGLKGAPVHADRYARAEEFVDVVTQLWDSWEDDAIVGDRASGHYAHADKVHAIDHEGRHFCVKGPLTVPRSAQGRPVLVQAGASEGGKALAARSADAVFTTQTTLPDALAFYAEIKNRARAFGRHPDSIKIMPGLSTVIGSTEAEAKRRAQELDEIQGLDARIEQVAQRIGIPASELDPDKPLPWDRIGDLNLTMDGLRSTERGSHGFFAAQINLARRENLTVRELAGRIRSGHRLVVGSAEQIADTLAEWFLAGAADGFNIMPDMFPSGARIFCEEVVPLLQRRGLFRTEYEGTTLREHLGLERPESVFALRRGERAAAAG